MSSLKFYNIDAFPPPKIQNKIKNFESQFKYSLPRFQKYWISHSPDYTSFYRSFGVQAYNFALEHNYQIIGSFSLAIRSNASYISNIRLHHRYKNGFVLYYLLAPVWKLLKGYQYYTVLVNNKQESFKKFFPYEDKRYLLMLETKNDTINIQSEIIDPMKADGIYKSLTNQNITQASLGLRSMIEPVWLNNKAQAICRIEDTRRAKILYDENGQEIILAYLTHFAYKNAIQGFNLLCHAMSFAAQKGYKFLCFSLTETEVRELEPFLKKFDFDKVEIRTLSNGPIDFPIHASEI